MQQKDLRSAPPASLTYVLTDMPTQFELPFENAAGLGLVRDYLGVFSLPSHQRLRRGEAG